MCYRFCNKLVILFAAATLIGLNGINRKTWAALLSTLCVLAMIVGIFDLVMRHMEGTGLLHNGISWKH